MNYVLPIIPSSEEELSVMLSNVCGKPLALHLAECIASIDCARLHVYTTNDKIQSLFQSNGISILHEPRQDVALKGSYQDDLAAALRYLVKHGVLSNETPVIGADCRNPFITKATFTACQALLTENASTGYATFENVRDHPLQLFNIHRVGGINTFVFLEPQTRASNVLRKFGIDGDCLISAPFHFDWRGMDIWDERPIAYTVASTLKTPVVHPRFEPYPLLALHDGQRVFLWESPRLARRIFERNEAMDPDEAHDAFSTGVYPPLRIRRESKGVTFSRTRGDDGAHRVLRAWAFAEGSEKAAGEWALPPWSENPQQCRLELADSVDGILAIVLEQPQDGTYDYLEHVPGHGLWVIDSVTGRPKDRENGRLLCNRQDFPSLAVRDDALLAGTVGRLLAGDAPDLIWETISLGELEKTKVRTPLDILWARSNSACPDKPIASSNLNLAHHSPKKRVAPVDSSFSPLTGEPVHLPEAGLSTDIAHIERVVVDFRKHKMKPLGENPIPTAGIDWDAAIAVLSEQIWIFRNISETLHESGHDPEAEKQINAIVTCRLKQCTSLRNEVLEITTSLDSTPGGEPKASVESAGVDLLKLSSLARGRARRVAITSPTLPASPEMITSDGLSQLYICSRSQPTQLDLQSKCLVTGTVKNIGLRDTSYHGAWFDPEQKLLYSLCFLTKERRIGIDIFNPNGKHTERINFSNNKFFNPMYIARIHGNSSSLFLMDYSCWLLYEVDKKSLSITDIHQFQGIFGTSDFKCAGKYIYFCDIIDNTVIKHDVNSKHMTSLSNLDMAYPSQIEYDEKYNSIILVTVDKIQRSITPVMHYLKIFDDELNLKSSTPLGSMFVRSITFMKDSRRVVLADQYGGILCYEVEKNHDPCLMHLPPRSQHNVACCVK